MKPYVFFKSIIKNGGSTASFPSLFLWFITLPVKSFSPNSVKDACLKAF